MSKYTEAEMAFLQDLREASVFELARMAGCHVYSGQNGPGAEFLGEIRDAVVQRWEAGRFDWDSANNDGDLIDECAAEGIITQYIHERMLLFVDLGAYSEANEHTMHGVWEGSFEDLASEAIEQIAYRAAVEFVAEVRRNFGAKFECGDCGDSGSPHRCFPGECNGSDEDREAWAISREAERLSAGPDSPAHPTQAPMPVEAPSEADRALWDQALRDAANDPLMKLLETASPSETQRFMANMAQVNREEFARRRTMRRTWLGVLAVVTSGALVMWMAWAILKGM